MKDRIKEVVANSLENILKEFDEKVDNILKLIKFMKKDGKNVKGVRCTRGKDRELVFSKNERKE